MPRCALVLAALVSLCACRSESAPPKISLGRDDAGLRIEFETDAVDASAPGTGGRDAGIDRLVRAAPQRTRDVGLCSADHWCWESPRPQGNALTAIWAAADGSEVFAVGAQGLALRYDGKDWTRVPTGTAAALTAIWGADREHLFAAGRGALLRFDGSAFKRDDGLPDGAELLWGSAANDVWAAGSSLAHFDGERWTLAVPEGAFSVVDLTGTGARDVWALGRDEGKASGQALLWRFNGKAWARSALPFALQSGSILPLSPNEAWLATDQGVLARFEGKAWKKSAELGAGARPVLTALPKGGAALVGPRRTLHRLEAGAWRKAADGAPAILASCAAGDARWAVGESGLVARWSGERWSPEGEASFEPLRAVSGSALDDVWAVGEAGTVLRRGDDHLWSPVARLKGALRSVWAGALDDVWVAGDAELAHWNGREFTSSWEPAMGPIKGVFGSSGASVFAVGDAGVRRWDRARWETVETPAAYPLDAVTAGRGDVWALGSGGMIHFDGREWSEVGAGKADAPTVLFLGPAGPYAAGAQGVWRYDGKSWASVLSRVETVAGYAAAADDVWVLGRGDEARHWNGVGWRKSATGAQAQLRAIWSRNGEAWAVGDGGAILHLRP